MTKDTGLFIDVFKQEDGSYLDALGVTHSDASGYISHLFSICGCSGDSWSGSVMKILEYYAKEEWDWEEFVERSFYGDYGLAYLVANIVEREDLAEHGSSLRTAWLTEKGKELLYDMKIVYG